MDYSPSRWKVREDKSTGSIRHSDEGRAGLALFSVGCQRHLLPCAAVEGSPGVLLVDAVPLLEEEGDVSLSVRSTPKGFTFGPVLPASAIIRRAPKCAPDMYVWSTADLRLIYA